MTVEVDDTVERYTISGTGPYAFSFRIFDEDDLTVRVIDGDGLPATLTIDTDYTVPDASVDDEDGGTISLIAATATLYAGLTLDIRSDTPIEQPTDMDDQGAFRLQAIENALDRQTRQLQDVRRLVKSCLRLQDIGTFDAALSPLANWLSKYVYINADGEPEPAAGISNVTLTKSVIAGLLFDQTDAESDEGVTPTDYAYQPGDPFRYGVVGDGVADDTAALNRWASVPGHKFGRPLTCKVTGQINLLPNEDIDWRGMIINGSTGVSFTNNAVVYSTGTLTQIADLNASPTLLSRSLAFGAAHTLAENDVGIIYNPTNSSFSAARAYYRAGEFFKVESVTSATAVKVWNGLYSAYTFGDVDVYKMAANNVRWRNLTVIAPSSGLIAPIFIRLATRLRLSDVVGTGSGYAGIVLDRCNDGYITGVTASVNVQAVDNKYAVAIGNCQDVIVEGGQLESVRHCVNIGGDDLVGGVPNTNIRIRGMTLKSDSAYSSSEAADIHGNCRDTRYENCAIWGGAGLNGLNVGYYGCKFYEFGYSGGAMILAGSEWMGGTIDIVNCDLRATPGILYALGMIRVRTGTNAIADTHVNIRGITCDAGATDVFFRGDVADATFKINVNIKGVTFRNSAAIVNICRMSGTGAAGDSDYIAVDDIVGAPAGATLYTAALGFGAATTNVRLMAQRGTVAVTPVSGANTAASTAVTFPLSYGSKTPHITLGQDQSHVNSKAINARVSSVTAAGFTANVFTCDAANFGAATPVVNVTWMAGT